jgi:hypothetical protein
MAQVLPDGVPLTLWYSSSPNSLSLYTGDAMTHNEAEEATATARVVQRRHVAMVHDEAVLRGYGAWEVMSGHRAR